MTGETSNEQLRELVERAAAPKQAAEPEAATAPMIVLRIRTAAGCAVTLDTHATSASPSSLGSR